MTDNPVRNGDHHVALINGEWHVLFEPADLPFNYLSIARFHSKERAESYAEMEAGMLDDSNGEQFMADIPAFKQISGGEIRPGSIVAILAAFFRSGGIGSPKQIEQSPAGAPQPIAEAPRSVERLEAVAEEPDTEDPTPAPTPEPPKQVRQARGPYKTNADALHAAMLAMRDGENLVHASYSQLFKNSGVPEGSVEAALYSLTQKGMLRRESPKGAPLVYRVLLDKSGDRLSSKPAHNIKKAPAYSADVGENIAGINGSAGPELPKVHVDGLPGRLAVVGKYLIAGRHNIKAGGAEAAIANILIERWGNDTPGEEIIGRIAETCKVKNGEARSAMGIMTESLNKKIECAGLVVHKNAEGWRLHVFDEAKLVSEGGV